MPGTLNEQFDYCSGRQQDTTVRQGVKLRIVRVPDSEDVGVFITIVWSFQEVEGRRDHRGKTRSTVPSRQGPRRNYLHAKHLVILRVPTSTVSAFTVVVKTPVWSDMEREGTAQDGPYTTVVFGQCYLTRVLFCIKIIVCEFRILRGGANRGQPNVLNVRARWAWREVRKRQKLGSEMER